jgi:hypothetical protein
MDTNTHPEGADESHEANSALEESEADGVYLLQLVDQYSTGLWARSLCLQQVVSKEVERARRAANPEGRIESVSYTYLAVQSILAYTGDLNHPSIRLAVRGLLGHRTRDGGFSSLEVTPTINPASGPQPVVNARHTAAAGLALALTGGMNSSELLQTGEVLLRLVNHGGGWGNGGDPYGNRSECLSTALSLEFLVRLKEIRSESKSNLPDGLDEAVDQGTNWLVKYFESHSHWRIEEGRGPIEDTAWIIAVTPTLGRMRPRIHELGCTYLLQHQSARDHGWGPVEQRPSDLRATLWVVRALVETSGTAGHKAVLDGHSFVGDRRGEVAAVMSLDTGHWSTLLYLAAKEGRRVTGDSDSRLRQTATELLHLIESNPQGFKGRVKTLRGYALVREPIRRLLARSAHERTLWDRLGDPIESLLDRTPRWVRWLVGSALLLIGVGLPLYLALVK